MLQTYELEELKQLGGREVLAADGKKVGYVDLVFRDNDTGIPEWLGIWDGLPDSKPRVLVPVRSVEFDGTDIRIPWSADVVRGAPAYEAPGDVAIGHDDVVEITPETERAAYDHYGVEPPGTPREPVAVVRFRVWRI